MKKANVVAVLAVIGFILSASGIVYATDDPGTVKEEIAADKETIKDERAEIKEHAESAKSEEKALRSEIKEARQSGDVEKAKELKTTLKETHRTNVTEIKQDRKQLRETKKELKQDRKAARKAGRAGGR